MKKLTAMMIALVLAFALGCAAFAEHTGDLTVQQESWLRDSLTNTGWMEKNGNRITLDIEPDPDGEDEFKAVLIQSNGADESIVMTFYCNYDPYIHTLKADRVVCVRENYTESSSEPVVTPIYDRESQTVFKLDEDGTLLLRNEAYMEDNENDIFLMGFTRVSGVEKGKKLSEEARKTCEKALDGILGAGCEPQMILAEKDTKLCVLCEASSAVPDSAPVFVLLFIDTAAENESFPSVVLLNDDGSEG